MMSFQMWNNVISREYHSEFRDKKVVVAGGAGGIGTAIASGLHWLGARVIILDKNEAEATALADRLGAACIENFETYRPQVIVADLADENERTKVVASVCSDDYPRALISTLGSDTRGDLASLRQDKLEQLLRINFIAPVMLARDFIEPIRRAGGGSICLFTSHHGSDLCETNMMGYGAAKAALDNGIRRLAKFAGDGNTAENSVRVFGLRPGWVLTEKQRERFGAAELDAAVERQLVPMRIQAEDLVPFVISNLCERNAKLLSGSIVDYDAGGLLERKISV